MHRAGYMGMLSGFETTICVDFNNQYLPGKNIDLVWGCNKPLILSIPVKQE